MCFFTNLLSQNILLQSAKKERMFWITLTDCDYPNEHSACLWVWIWIIPVHKQVVLLALPQYKKVKKVNPPHRSQYIYHIDTNVSYSSARFMERSQLHLTWSTKLVESHMLKIASRLLIFRLYLIGWVLDSVFCKMYFWCACPTVC